MTITYKDVTQLTPDDFEFSSVWEFATDREVLGDTVVRPVAGVPVSSMTNRLVGTKVRLANGALHWASLGSLDLQNAERTQHFLSVSIFDDARWFHLARYYDLDYAERGPAALSNFLGLKSEDIFPIVYDVRRSCIGHPEVVVGAVYREPKKTLTRAEIIALAVP